MELSMADLRNIMDEAVSDIADPEESVVQTDLALGRQALARQRTRRVRRQILIPVGIAAAAAGVFGISVLGNGPGSGATVPHGISAASTSTSDRIALISYAGEQPDGFKIDAVPDGWTIQEVSHSYVSIAPVGSKNKDIKEFTGKIAIFVADEEDMALKRHEMRPLRVGDVTATRFTYPDGDMVANTTDEPMVGPNSPAGLLLPEGKETLLFQFPDGHDWDDAIIAKFAAGVHLTDAGRAAR
jgi:hypothetical protein